MNLEWGKLIDAAIADGRLTEKSRGIWMRSFEENEAVTVKTLARLTPCLLVATPREPAIEEWFPQHAVRRTGGRS